jgi:hypothetical protein
MMPKRPRGPGFGLDETPKPSKDTFPHTGRDSIDDSLERILPASAPTNIPGAGNSGLPLEQKFTMVKGGSSLEISELNRVLQEGFYNLIREFEDECGK